MWKNQDCKTAPIDYLIVTRPLFAACSELLDFIQWKEQRGFHVGLLTVEWIEANYQGPHAAARIKAAAFDTYAGSRVAYLLLVGDTQVDVPSDQIGWYEPVEMYDLSKPWNVPTGVMLEEAWPAFTDAYFADADAWPLDADGHPHLHFPCHLDFDIAVGRFPVRQPGELVHLVAKSRTFTPATSVLLVDAMNDAPYTRPPDPCAAWPPPYGDLAAEGACYGHSPYSIQRALAGSGVALMDHLLHLNVPVEAALARTLVLGSTSITDVVCHGGHTENFILHASDLGSFTAVFPLYVIGSCMVGTFYWLATDSMAETMLKAATGPVAVVEPKNEYSFYRALGCGESVGRAVYSRDKIFHAGLGTMSLLGDPSLVLCQVPAKPPDWRPHRRWYWLRVVVDIWQRVVEGVRRAVSGRPRRG